MNSNEKVISSVTILYKPGYNPLGPTTDLLRYFKDCYGKDSMRITYGYHDSNISKFTVMNNNSIDNNIIINIRTSANERCLEMLIFTDNNHDSEIIINNVRQILMEDYAEQIVKIEVK